MYKRSDGDYLCEEFVKKVDEFIKFATEEEHFNKICKA